LWTIFGPILHLLGYFSPAAVVFLLSHHDPKGPKLTDPNLNWASGLNGMSSIGGLGSFFKTAWYSTPNKKKSNKIQKNNKCTHLK
jgi:hypothetical protein